MWPEIDENKLVTLHTSEISVVESSQMDAVKSHSQDTPVFKESYSSGRDAIGILWDLPTGWILV